VSEMELIFPFSDFSSKVLCQEQLKVHLVIDTKNLCWHNLFIINHLSFLI